VNPPDGEVSDLRKWEEAAAYVLRNFVARQKYGRCNAAPERVELKVRCRRANEPGHAHLFEDPTVGAMYEQIGVEGLRKHGLIDDRDALTDRGRELLETNT
jgi:hypothetical protein